MQPPRDPFDEILLGAKIEKRAIELADARVPEGSRRVKKYHKPEDQEFLNTMIALIDAGHPAIIVVKSELDERDDGYKYMLSNLSRLDAGEMLSRISLRNSQMLKKDHKDK